MHRKQAWSKRVRKERFRKKYLSRMQATRLLQVDAMNFRRLCILKGIYPRAIGRSKQKASGNDKQYYLTREIRWLVHDQIPGRIQAFHAWEKKINRAKAMRNREMLKVLTQPSVKPMYQLDATIKERYPRFLDAVKDIDDAMTVISLYAFLSPEIRSDTTIEFHHALSSGLHDKAVKVLQQWLSYVARSRSLHKGFISIKGYYFQAHVKGEKVLWLMPHEYASKFPSGVQQYILVTFLEFYVELMRFVLFKLESDLARELEEQQLQVDAGPSAEPGKAVDFGATVSIDVGNDAAKAVLLKLERERVAEREKIASLFAGNTFYLSREVPVKPLTLLIHSCGGRIVSEMGPSVTHYVVDRPTLLPPHTLQPSVEYVQPQYLFDCLNARSVLPVNGYRIGEELPPHVSPFTVSISNSAVDREDVEETLRRHTKIVSYVPKRVHEIRKIVDPSYVAVDPKKKIAESGEVSDDDEANLYALERDSGDDVSLSGDEVAAATKLPAWKDEKVIEHPERPALSALKVKKQRELNLMNAPRDEVHAAKRAQKANAAEQARKTESRKARLARKVKQAEKEEHTKRKMQLQVARKKAARYYKMVSGAVEGAKRRETALRRRAAALDHGAAKITEDGTAVVSSHPKKKSKDANPYRKLPKWVQ